MEGNGYDNSQHLIVIFRNFLQLFQCLHGWTHTFNALVRSSRSRIFLIDMLSRQIFVVNPWVGALFSKGQASEQKEVGLSKDFLDWCRW